MNNPIILPILLITLSACSDKLTAEQYHKATLYCEKYNMKYTSQTYQYSTRYGISEAVDWGCFNGKDLFKVPDEALK